MTTPRCCPEPTRCTHVPTQVATPRRPGCTHHDAADTGPLAGSTRRIGAPPRGAGRRAGRLAVAACGALWLACATAGAEPAARWTRLAPGLEARRIAVVQTEAGFPVHLHALRVALTRYEARVLDARRHGRRRAPVAELADQEGALAAINASFFLADGTPLGLLVSEGRRIAPLRKVDWGVLAIDAHGRARIVHARRWRDDASIRFAIEAGPRLVVGGRPLHFQPGLARRSAVCIGSDRQHLTLVASDGPLSLRELAHLLVTPEPAGGLGCHDALNLDGGSSTQLHVAVPEAGIGVPAMADVPVALGIFVRP